MQNEYIFCEFENKNTKVIFTSGAMLITLYFDYITTMTS